MARGEALASRHDVVGSVRERGLLDRVYKDTTILDAPVRDVMDEALPVLDARDTVDAAMTVLTGSARAALVCEGPVPVGVLTRADILTHLTTPGA